MNLPVFDCLIDENLTDESGIYAISFVDAPANEIDFVALSAQAPKKEYLCRDSKKQILTGVVLRPDQLIFRSDKRLGEYYIRFQANEIEKIARKMMKTGIALQHTTHQHENRLDGNYLVELWIVENPELDKSRALGFEPMPKGTLMCSYKIEDKKYWDSQVMTGNVRGFSLEGFFFQQSVNSNINSKNNQTMNKIGNTKKNSLLSKLTQFLLDVVSVQKTDITQSGTAYVVFTLTDGKEVRVDADGFATLAGEQLPSGEHTLSDGNVLVVDDQGQFIETKESSVKNQNPEQATAPQALSNNEEIVDEKDKKKTPKASDNESVELLKAKIAELESKLSELSDLARDAGAEVQKLRKVTPSILPATALASNVRCANRHEQMAQALSQTIRKRKYKL